MLALLTTFTFSFLWLAMTHGFILILRHFCQCLEQIISSHGQLLRENFAVEEQNKIARIFESVDKIYSDIFQLLRKGAFFFNLPVTFLLFFCFSSAVSMLFVAFDRVRSMQNLETIFQEGVPMVTECLWTLVYLIYVGTIIKNLDILSQQVSCIFKKKN
jgi:hypothetical protein